MASEGLMVELDIDILTAPENAIYHSLQTESVSTPFVEHYDGWGTTWKHWIDGWAIVPNWVAIQSNTRTNLKFNISAPTDNYIAYQDGVSSGVLGERADGTYVRRYHVTWGTQHQINYICVWNSSKMIGRNESVCPISYAKADTIPPTYTNFQNNGSTARINGLVNWSIDYADGVGLSYYFFAHNQSGTLTNVSNGSLSGTASFINYTLPITLTRGNYICGQFWANDTSNNTNQTNLSCFSVVNSNPIISSVTLNDTFLEVGEHINITCIASDADSDTITFNYLWYINGTATTFDTFHLQGGNLTIGANITGSCNATDSIGFSSWQNTSTTTVGDTTSPVISGLSISSTSGVIGTVIIIGATCTESNNLAIGHPKVAIIHSVAGLKENKTMSLVSGSDYSTTYTTAESSGTYTFSFYCNDGSGNEESNLSNSLLFTATTPGTTPPPPGGGGGAPPPTQCETDEDCEVFGDKYVCIQNFCIYQEFESVCNYDGICSAERGENLINCGDVFVNNTLVLSGDCSFADLPRIALSLQYVLYSIIGLIIIGTITFNQMAKKPEQRFKAFRIPKKFFRRKK